MEAKSKSVRTLQRKDFNEPIYRQLLEKKWGERYTEYRKKWESAADLKIQTDFPLHIDLDTIDHCNLDCHYCSEEHNYIRRRTFKKMEFSDIDELFKEVKNPAGKDRLCSVNIGTLGEPFLNPEKVFYILEKCIETEIMETFIHTNAQLLTLDMFKKLIQLELTYLLFSMDSIVPETYQEIRGKGFEKAMKNILEILEYKKKVGVVFPVTRVSMVETDMNRHEKKSFLDFWQYKVDYVDIQPCGDYTKKVPEEIEIKFSCPMPFQRVGFGVKGQMGLCCTGYFMLPEFKIADFPEMSVCEAWNSNQANRLRESHQKMDFRDQPICRECMGVVQSALIDFRKETE